MRPSFHFSPKSGWINDPNGLIRVDGVYHLFYQANPHGLVHGPMHWGHATSTDLATWTEQPIALYPEASGQIFSGSAVAAGEGHVAREFEAGDGVLLFYTAHRDGTPAVEDQAVAIADRGMTRFRKFAGNPVLPTPGPRDFRDPKVIWHAPTGRWIMVVTHGQSIGIYSSPDALRWQFESEFGANEGRHDSEANPGPWECPDLFPMRVQGTGETAWILVVGLGRGHISGGSGTQYFVGDFDGHSFRNRNPASTELFMDWGRDFYAAQSFSGLGDEDPLVIGWMSNWKYANYTPNDGFRGSMNLPRRLQLADGPEGLRLVQSVDPSPASRFPQLTLSGGAATPASPVYRLRHRLEGRRLALSLFGEPDPILTVERLAGDRCGVTFHRPPHPAIEAGRAFESHFSFEATAVDAFDLDIFVDHGLVEIGCASGRHWVSNLYFPAEPAGTVQISG